MDALRVDGREVALQGDLRSVVAALGAQLGGLQAGIEQSMNMAQVAVPSLGGVGLPAQLGDLPAGSTRTDSKVTQGGSP
jgi:hypothetical protein